MSSALDTDPTVQTIRRIPATLSAIAPIRAELADALDRCNWDPGEAMGVVVAALEGMVNAVEHGSAEGAHVTVRYEVGPDRAEVTISDDGRPLADAAAPGDDCSRGRGMQLINGFATHLRFTWTGAGTVLSMAFERRAASLA
jgi:anti-sigma regulatory factor (Ser/Thr protein kinase)